jgi:hypothetical protein
MGKSGPQTAFLRGFPKTDRVLGKLHSRPDNRDFFAYPCKKIHKHNRLPDIPPGRIGNRNPPGAYR